MDPQGPAQTLNYMIGGYAVFFTVLAAYLISLFIRLRNLRQESQMLQEIEKEKNIK